MLLTQRPLVPAAQSASLEQEGPPPENEQSPGAAGWEHWESLVRWFTGGTEAPLDEFEPLLVDEPAPLEPLDEPPRACAHAHAHATATRRAPGCASTFTLLCSSLHLAE